MEKAVVVMSGGLDSVVLAYFLKTRYDLLPLAFDYGQHNDIELGFARYHAELLNSPFKIATLASLAGLLESGLTTTGKTAESGTYEDTIRSTFVPNRNAIFLSIAYGYAISQQADTVAYGTHGRDHGEFSLTPDCTPPFRESLEAAFREGNRGYYTPDLYAPFIIKSKADIVRIGADLGVQFEQTWSCYLSLYRHCGRCGACTERKKAFTVSGVTDPTEYLE